MPKRKAHVSVSKPSENGEAPKKKGKWLNKTRTLIFSSRGVDHRARHLMQDIQRLMPHSKKESKMDRKDQLMVINEIAAMRNCNKCLFFEAKKKQDLYLWVSNVPRGPSCKFLVENIHTLSELKMTGNCLASSRPILSFDKAFNQTVHMKLMKELFIQVFGTPNCHPKSQPFFDRVLTFSLDSKRIFVRHYQIVEEDGSLAEIGPRFALNPIRMFEGSFGGPTLYQNPHYISPNMHRRQRRDVAANKYKSRVEHKKGKKLPENAFAVDPLDEVFSTHHQQPESDSDSE